MQIYKSLRDNDLDYHISEYNKIFHNLVTAESQNRIVLTKLSE